MLTECGNKTSFENVLGVWERKYYCIAGFHFFTTLGIGKSETREKTK